MLEVSKHSLQVSDFLVMAGGRCWVGGGLVWMVDGDGSMNGVGREIVDVWIR